mmetsp:Transcript_67613/g.150916  ORF Transcript_67613/g.150916 Transcript_67613/m.150916 type:complete len:203 (+) Transcript_67613:1211-1819(+)
MQLRNRLGRALRLLRRTEPDKRGIRHVTQHVVHTELKDPANTLLRQLVESARPVQGEVAAAVAIRCHAQLTRGREHQLGVFRKAWVHPLLEENELRRWQTKVLIILEVVLGELACGVRGHNHEWQPHPRLRDPRMRRRKLLHSDDPFCMVLVEALSRRQPDVVHTLGRGCAEARALPAREEQRGHLPAGNHVEPPSTQRTHL